MRADQANNLDFPVLLSRLGYEPTSIKKGGNELWYNSPFRKEKESSFHISKGRKYAWVWKDFGDEGGTVIDFIMRLHGHRSLKKVLDYLKTLQLNRDSITQISKRVGENPKQTSLFSFHGQKAPQGRFLENRTLEFINAHQIQNSVIYSYLKGRGIPKDLADKYLREVKYRNVNIGKEFFAFGMRNESGGYEVRAATDEYSFKSALIKRDITLIKGLKENATTVNVFEGMVDFLSLLVMLNTSNLSGDSIVMHSLSSFERTLIAIKSMKYSTVNTFLDNNRAGQEHSQKFKLELGEIVISQSSMFEPYEDLNDALKVNAIPDFLNK